jgi:hypothetical protein
MLAHSEQQLLTCTSRSCLVPVWRRSLAMTPPRNPDLLRTVARSHFSNCSNACTAWDGSNAASSFKQLPSSSSRPSCGWARHVGGQCGKERERSVCNAVYGGTPIASADASKCEPRVCATGARMAGRVARCCESHNSRAAPAPQTQINLLCCTPHTHQAALIHGFQPGLHARLQLNRPCAHCRRRRQPQPTRQLHELLACKLQCSRREAGRASTPTILAWSTRCRAQRHAHTCYARRLGRVPVRRRMVILV